MRMSSSRTAADLARRERLVLEQEARGEPVDTLGVKAFAIRFGVKEQSIYAAIRHDRFPYPVRRPMVRVIRILPVPPLVQEES